MDIAFSFASFFGEAKLIDVAFSLFEMYSTQELSNKLEQRADVHASINRRPQNDYRTKEYSLL